MSDISKKMDNNILVSIVMPTYNGSAYIRNCIEATIEQTYSNFELIIVDDGSTDSVRSICELYAAKDNRITVISVDNRGVSTSRNIGIDAAHGDYIVFFDDDDYPEKNLIEKYIDAYKQWENKSVSFVTCGMAVENDFNKRVSDKNAVLEAGRGYILGENYLLTRSSAATLAWLRLFNFVTNKCYDLKKVKEYNIRFDNNVCIAEDLKFNIDYLENCEGNIGMINMPLYHYVKRKDDGLSLKYHSDDLKNTKEIYRSFLKWAEKQPGVTTDNLCVIKALYITDWTNRLTAIYKTHKGESLFSCSKRSINKELRCSEYRKMLNEIHREKKISTFRYACLKTGWYQVFYFFRMFYQALKG